MMQVIYCYDAYCGWCYGFSPVIKKIADRYKNVLRFEVLSGGMVISDPPKHINATAGYIKKSYQHVESTTGIVFGDDYLWHINNPDDSDWFPDSRKPATALCIFKEIYPALQVAFAHDLQHALFAEGRDLCDNEAYRHLLEKYHIDEKDFYDKLGSEEYSDKAAYEFALVKQLQVTGYPAVLMQESETKFYLVTRGYAEFERLDSIIQSILQVK
jgi:putative protein-disulfide isomerase